MFKNLKLAGAGYVILNIIRVLTIITLGTIIAASWIMLVKTVQNSDFFFFDSVSHFMTSTISIFLVVSELCLFKRWYASNWPLLSEQSGLITLALALIIMGCQMLGNLNKDATSQEKLGLPFWRVIVAAGILGFVLGFFNLVVHFLFRLPRKGITSRMIRAHGAKVLVDDLPKSMRSASSGSNRSNGPRSFDLPSYTKSNEGRASRFSFAGFKFGNPLRGSMISRPVPTDTAQFKEWDGRTQPISPAGSPVHLQKPAPAFGQGRHPAYTASVYSRDSRGI